MCVGVRRSDRSNERKEDRRVMSGGSVSGTLRWTLSFFALVPQALVVSSSPLFFCASLSISLDHSRRTLDSRPSLPKRKKEREREKRSSSPTSIVVVSVNDSNPCLPISSSIVLACLLVLARDIDDGSSRRLQSLLAGLLNRAGAAFVRHATWRSVHHHASARSRARPLSLLYSHTCA